MERQQLCLKTVHAPWSPSRAEALGGWRRAGDAPPPSPRSQAVLPAQFTQQHCLSAAFPVRPVCREDPGAPSWARMWVLS